jgi:hypothetical protein
VADQEGKNISLCASEKIRQQLRLDILPSDESVLLARIYAPLNTPEREQRDALLSISERTEAQEKELLRLIDLVEVGDANRWQAISQLGQLKGKSIVGMAQSLGITNPKSETIKINIKRHITLRFREGGVPNVREGNPQSDMTFIIDYAYSEVRLMIDCETEDRKWWVEYCHEGKPVRLNHDDVVLVHD